jgi:hypothetical protein
MIDSKEETCLSNAMQHKIDGTMFTQHHGIHGGILRIWGLTVEDDRLTFILFCLPCLECDSVDKGRAARGMDAPLGKEKP